MIEKLKSLHACWELTTGQQVNYRATERVWYELANLDFTEDDLICVLKHVLQYNKTHSHCHMKVQVSKLCGDVELFASICAEARAVHRNKLPKQTPKEIILHDFRGVSPEPNGNVKRFADVLRTMQSEL